MDTVPDLGYQSQQDKMYRWLSVETLVIDYPTSWHNPLVVGRVGGKINKREVPREPRRVLSLLVSDVDDGGRSTNWRSNHGTWFNAESWIRDESNSDPNRFDASSRSTVISADFGRILVVLGGFWLDFGVLEAFREDFVHFAAFSSVFSRNPESFGRFSPL